MNTQELLWPSAAPFPGPRPSSPVHGKQLSCQSLSVTVTVTHTWPSLQRLPSVLQPGHSSRLIAPSVTTPDCHRSGGGKSIKGLRIEVAGRATKLF